MTNIVSFYLHPNENSNFFLKDSIIIPEINHETLDNNIGYIKIGGLVANDSLSSIYSLKIRSTLKKIDSHPNLSGWIIDLRNNKGGKGGTFSLGPSTGGFTTVLDGLKAYLEHNFNLNLIGDKYPKEVSNHNCLL